MGGQGSKTLRVIGILCACIRLYNSQPCKFALLFLPYCQFFFSPFISFSFLQGSKEVSVDSSIITFVNHGCKGEYNVGIETDVDEFSADLDEPIEGLNGKSHTGTSIFNPVIDRHLLSHVGDLSIEGIDAGEEILDNYLAFVGSEEDWEEDIRGLRRMCKGMRVEGSVTDYEDYYDGYNDDD